MSASSPVAAGCMVIALGMMSMFSMADNSSPANSPASPRQMAAAGSQTPRGEGQHQQTMRSGELPAVWLQIPVASLMEQGPREFERTHPCDYTILGTKVQGESISSGHYQVRFQPSDEAAVLVIEITGTSESETVGVNGPATIESRTSTDYVATKVVRLSADGISMQPTDVKAEAEVTTVAVQAGGSGGLASGVVQKIAERRVAKSRPEVERQTAEIVANRVRKNLDRMTEERLAQLRAVLIEPLEEVAGPGRRIHFCSTEDHLRIGMYSEATEAAQQPAWPDDAAVSIGLNVQSIGDLALAPASGESFTMQQIGAALEQAMANEPSGPASEPAATLAERREQPDITRLASLNLPEEQRQAIASLVSSSVAVSDDGYVVLAHELKGSGRQATAARQSDRVVR